MMVVSRVTPDFRSDQNFELARTHRPSPRNSSLTRRLFFCPRLNGSLPDNVEVQNSTLFFKGPVTYSLAGTYVCEATNTIGTRSGLVEVNVTGRNPNKSPPRGLDCIGAGRGALITQLCAELGHLCVNPRVFPSLWAR